MWPETCYYLALVVVHIICDCLLSGMCVGCTKDVGPISCATNENQTSIYSEIVYIKSSTSLHVGRYSVASCVVRHLFCMIREYSEYTIVSLLKFNILCVLYG
jgi:uncharacterized membrane protein